MKIELKKNKKLFNNFFMYKEKGENIILGGGDGSARLEILLQFFLYMVKNNQNLQLIFMQTAQDYKN